MPRNQRIWLTKAIKHFEHSPNKTFTKAELAGLRRELADDLQIPQSISANVFMAALMQEGHLREIIIAPTTSPIQGSKKRKKEQTKSDKAYKPFKRYTWGEATPYEMALSLRSGSYLSHATAVFLHGLTDQIPRTIYANKEQSKKPEPVGNLTQEAINRAFANNPRSSNFIFAFQDTRIVLLSGKNTDNLEVTELSYPNKTLAGTSLAYPTTKLERTLIDIVVRPAYAGGIFEVQAAFHGAFGRLSIPILAATLKRLQYVYPYHQALGFYLTRAGYNSEQLDRLRKPGLKFDFYLGHQIPNPKYDKQWRVHYPSGL